MRQIPEYLDPEAAKAVWRGRFLDVDCRSGKNSSGHSFPYFFSISSIVGAFEGGRVIFFLSPSLRDEADAKMFRNLMFSLCKGFLSFNENMSTPLASIWTKRGWPSGSV